MPERTRPLIGITGPSRRLAGGRIAACAWVRMAGGQPLWMAPNRPRPDRRLAGLVVTGGTDLDPLLYGGESGPWVQSDPPRDEFELAALGLAWQRGLPILGICRGAQLMNVFAGGNLHADITNLRRLTSNKPSIRPVKMVNLEPASQLAKIVGATSLKVNSLHHQAVDRPGTELNVTGLDEDNIVQAIENPHRRFFIGVQWHPEYLAYQRPHRALFAALVDSAADLKP